MNIVLDTNILISFLIGKLLRKLGPFIKTKKYTILTSDEQMIELHDVLTRPKLKKYFSDEERILMLRLIKRRFKRVEIKKKIKKCRDEKDNFILDIAINGKAKYIITGDKDLLDLNPLKGIEIITFKDFLRRI